MENVAQNKTELGFSFNAFIRLKYYQKFCDDALVLSAGS